MATGICFHELSLIAEMLNQEHCLISCMRDSGEPPELTSEVRSYSAAIGQLAMLLPVLNLAAMDMERTNSWVA